jgi:hypothetical protein
MGVGGNALLLVVSLRDLNNLHEGLRIEGTGTLQHTTFY